MSAIPSKTDSQTINDECPRAGCEQTSAHSKGKPDAPSLTTKISVQFATSLPVEVKIRHLSELPDPEPGPMSGISQAAARILAAITGGNVNLKTWLIVMVLSVAALAGCQRHTEPAPTITTNIASSFGPTNSTTSNNPTMSQ